MASTKDMQSRMPEYASKQHNILHAMGRDQGPHTPQKGSRGRDKAKKFFQQAKERKKENNYRQRGGYSGHWKSHGDTSWQ